MSNQNANLPVILLRGKYLGTRANFDSAFDATHDYTEGQIRALQMRLNRLIGLEQFVFNSQYELDGSDSVYFTANTTPNGKIVFATVIKKSKLTESLKASIERVSSVEGILDAKTFYQKLVQQQKSAFSDENEDDLNYGEAIEYLVSLQKTEENMGLLNRIFQILVDEKIQSQYPLYENLIEFLKHVPEEIQADTILDASFEIATKYFNMNIFDKALEIYLSVAEIAKLHDRLPLMISSRLKAANISLEMNKDINNILTILSEIDDGSLEVATQDEREQFYSMQGYCFEKLGDMQTAEDLHFMAIMISESETSPSIWVAKSHAFMGKIAGKSYQPEIATSQYLTASTIAHAKNDRYLGTLYSHQASTYELQWAKMLSSTALVMKMNSDQANAEFYAWQSLKRLVNSISHSDRNLRKRDLIDGLDEVIEMNQYVLPETSQYAITTLNELQKQLNFFVEGLLPLDQEKELLKFISTKISAMLPLPPPVVMIIANDGRLILGGEVGAEKWDQSYLTNDDLFSGALSAIMAILSEVISGEDYLRMLDAGQTQIMIEKSKYCIGAVLVDRDLNILRKALKDSLDWMTHQYPDLENWDGYSIDFSAAKPKIEAIFEEAVENIAG